MPVVRGHFRAGLATVDITADPASARVELSGYVARRQPAQAVRDRVEAAALALQIDAGPPVAIVALDACTLDSAAAQRIAAACPVPDDRLVLACTHTHSAPAVGALLGCGVPDAAYVRRLALLVGDAVRRAVAAMQPCRLGWGRRALAQPPWRNRREAGLLLDPRLHLLKIERAESDRTPVCALWSVACHPVVLGAENVAVSADFTGEVRRRLPFPSLFLQGCCGDQNPVRHGEAAMAQWEPAASGIEALWSVTPTAPAGPWAFHRAAVDLPRLAGDAAVVPPAGPGAAGTVAAAMRLWAETCARPGQAVPPSRAEVVVARVGNGRVAFWPGEPFVSLQLALAADVLATGHCGASVGYIPDAEAYARGGYEVALAHRYYAFPSALAPDAAPRLLAATAEALAALGEAASR